MNIFEILAIPAAIIAIIMTLYYGNYGVSKVFGERFNNIIMLGLFIPPFTVVSLVFILFCAPIGFIARRPYRKASSFRNGYRRARGLPSVPVKED